MITIYFLKNGKPEPMLIDRVLSKKEEKEMENANINISKVGEDILLGWDYSYINSDYDEMYKKGKEQEDFLIKFFNL